MIAARAHRKRPVNHSIIDPAILYFGTPVALLSTIADDGSPNTAPMSSVFWLGQTVVLGMGGRSQTAQNLLATGECVINLPSTDLVSAVDALALTTGRSPVPTGKARAGYRHESDKLRSAGLHGRPGDTVRAERIDECPVNLEAHITQADHSRRTPRTMTEPPSCSKPPSLESMFMTRSVWPARRTGSIPTGGAH